MRRRLCSFLGVLALVAGIGVTSATPVAAAPVPLDLEMLPGGGTLQIRGSEPYAIETPTTITGTQDEGVLTDLTFETPAVNFERPVTDPVPARAVIDASFDQLAPGSGSVDSEGNVTVQQQLSVDLHVEAYVPPNAPTPGNFPGDCVAEPVNLVMTGQYNETTKQVNLTAPDFTVPAVEINAECGTIIGDAVNKQLAGGGHSLSLLLEGDLQLPPEAPCATTTELAVSPADASPITEEVTYTATVAKVTPFTAECLAVDGDTVPLAGTAVDFFRGDTVIGSGVLDDTGTATFATSTLPAGEQTLTARYRTSFPFDTSEDSVAYRVTIGPVVSTDLPAFVPLAAPTEFGLTVTNSEFAAPIDDARVDITFRSFGATPQLERFDGTDWQPVPLTKTAAEIYFGSLPAFDLASGTAQEEQLRLSALPGSEASQVQIVFEVVPDSSTAVPQPSPDSLGRGSANTTFIENERVPSALDFSGVFPGPVDAHTVRQGSTITLPLGVTITPAINAYLPTGYVEVFVDGQPLPVAVWPGTLQNPALRVPVSEGTLPYMVGQLPTTIAAGVRDVTVRYSGDAVFLPSQASFNINVLPPRGTLYECYSGGAPAIRLRTQVTAQANLPSSAVPGELPLGGLDVVMTADRSLYTYSSFFGLLNDTGPTAIGEVGLEAVRFGFGDLGGATATGVTRSNTDFMFPDPNPDPNPDSFFTFDGEAGTLDLDGAVGEVVPINLETLEVDMRTEAGGIPYNLLCEPVGDPAFLGDVRVAGVGLTVAPASPVRSGDPVTLTADVGNPNGAGLAEFLDGTATIGVAPVSGGTATMTTDDLTVGAHSLKVRYYPQPSAPVLVSPEVALEVLPEFDCGAFVIEEDGVNGAVVRLVYMELLNRCPDQDGYDYWVGQLEDGVSPTAFARTIAYTAEALDQVVIDAYQTTLERDPSPEDRLFWRNRLRANGRYQDLLAALSGSPEFLQKAGSTRAGLVTRVYNRVLDRDPSEADLDYWVGELLSGKPRSSVMRTIGGLREPLGVIVRDSYREILDIDPSPAELEAGIKDLQRNGDRSALYSKLIGDARFRVRAVEYPNFDD